MYNAHRLYQWLLIEDNLEIYIPHFNKIKLMLECSAGPVDNATYLVEERQCINNHYLFNGNLNA